MTALGAWAFLVPVLAVAACAPSRMAPPSPPPPSTVGSAVAPLAMECAPFARALSGVALRGAAADWWEQADGRYARTQTPDVGAILVFQRTARLADGHVAVVSALRSEREILVTHANWLRGTLSEDAPVVDVSPDNDWSQVRVWWPPTAGIGATAYPAHGFIHPHRPPSREEMAWTARRLVAAAAGP